MTAATAQELYAVEEASGVAQARRRAQEIAQQRGLTEEEVSDAAIALTEAGTNLVKHGGGGKILLRALIDEDAAGLEVIVLDKGPGMADFEASARDGHSTVGTRGNGLGAMRRQATEFAVYTRPGLGTAIRMTFRAGRRLPAGRGSECGVVCLAVKGETACGDDWIADLPAPGADRILMVADGLGHGPQAAEASNAATALIRTSSKVDPQVLMGDVHNALRATRGAAVAIVRVPAGAGQLSFSGIGNISVAAHLIGGASKQFASRPGIVGHNVRKIDHYEHPWAAETVLVMHSDGLATHWNFAGYPGLLDCHPGLIAAVLYRDLERGRDDVTVLVAKMVAQ